jgi:CRISPR-associated protein Csb1
MKIEIDQLLKANGPVCLIITAHLNPVSGEDRFQPAGFPQVGHVIYDAPRGKDSIEKVCIVDSAASMANHLEKVCLSNGRDVDLHENLDGLPYVVCVTDGLKDGERRAVTSTLKEGHRLASDYFLDGQINGKKFREILRGEFGIKEVKKDKTYFTYPENWGDIYKTIFKYDPNSLIHGVLFAKEQVKINRMLTAHMDAYGAKRVGTSGVKFDPLGKTTSGQPIFSVDEETANAIRATFVLDIALLRSDGREKNGLNQEQKRLLLELALWKIQRLLSQPFRFRSNCFLQCAKIELRDETQIYNESLPQLNIRDTIKKCKFENPVTKVYYPASNLFKIGEADETSNSEDEKTEHDSESNIDEE